MASKPEDSTDCCIDMDDKLDGESDVLNSKVSDAEQALNNGKARSTIARLVNALILKNDLNRIKHPSI
jgi:hypothetical protein